VSGVEVVLDVPDEDARGVIEECVAEVWRTWENRDKVKPSWETYAADIERRMSTIQWHQALARGGK